MARKRFTRRRFVGAAGTTATLGITGCLGGGGGGGDTIRYLSDRGDSSDVIDEIIAEFEGEYDYTVDVTYTSRGTSTDEELQQMLAAGNPPDIVFDTSTDAYRYQRNGNLAPVSDAVQGTGLPDPVNVDGESYFAPTIVEPLMGWYRNDIYEEKPTTFETWRSEAQRVTEEEDDIDGYIVQSGQTNNAATATTQYLWQNDVEIYGGPSDNIEVTIDQGDNRNRAVETYSWLQEMSEYSPTGSGWGWGDGTQALQQENAAGLMSVGGLPILTIRENRPDLVENLSPTGFPIPEGGQQDKWWAYMEGHVVRNDGDATEGAQEFARFFSESDRFLDFVLSAPLFQWPPTEEGLNSDAVQENEVLAEHQDAVDLIRDNWDAFTTVLETGDGGVPNIVAADAYGQQMFGQSAEQMLVGGRSPEETVDWIAEELRGLQEE
ncbi:ABC transporter substrate-binding protein [Halolamina salifodinae]|uniref:Multiple sugar transport system substrate-binding protein n=1 Tax=Halolamina salifodinae TaxID=1202767 RepID=A0A8T4H244_9EURY|nr:ABC transporter substrate-binding protein [Halolamina salifodinae]MBP1987358.1 multiple sugar transport system substrate-binding protein [Halolamina salifodinae]